MSCVLNATHYPCRCVTSWTQSREQKLQACLCVAVQTPSFAPALGTLCSHSHATHQLESVWFVRGVALLPYWKTQAHHHWTSEPPAAHPETERSSFLPILASPAHTMFLLIYLQRIAQKTKATLFECPHLHNAQTNMHDFQHTTIMFCSEHVR